MVLLINRNLNHGNAAGDGNKSDLFIKNNTNIFYIKLKISDNNIGIFFVTQRDIS